MDIRTRQIEYLPVGALNPDPRNPRRHSKAQIRQIARSIKHFGFNVPILVDRANMVIAGHGRLEAARQLGFAEVPTIRLDHLTEAQARAFAIADNRLTENSTWDDKLLGQVFQELSVQNLDFDLQVTGFASAEIDLQIEGLADGDDQGDDAEQIPEPYTGRPVTKAGDVWVLGDHRVLCGNALDAAAYQLLLDGERADLVFTDPPYNVRIDGHVSGLGAVRHREFAMASGEMSADEFAAFLTVALGLHARNSVDGAIHYICMDWRHLDTVLAAGTAAYTELKNICVWVKNNAGMGSFYRSQHELVCVFKSGRGTHQNNIQLGRFGRARTNVWSYPGATTFSRTSDEGYLLGLHPTVKPVRMVADAILDCSRRGDVVLDGFLGSGTTVMAAERTGRRAFGLELDPVYTDTIVRRWQNYTGLSARHAVTGEAFAEYERELDHGR